MQAAPAAATAENPGGRRPYSRVATDEGGLMHPPLFTLRSASFLAAIVIPLFAVAAPSHADALPVPEVKALAPVAEVLRPAVSFLSREPVVDGRLDAELSGLPVRPFAFLYKPNPAVPDTEGTYRLAYGASFLYVFIDVKADRVICRDRGYQNGDGFVLSLYRPEPGNTRSREFVRLAYNPTGDAETPFAQMIWARNDDWPFDDLSDRSAFCVRAENGHVGFEALLRWDDVLPYHPWLGDPIGFNLLFVKAIGETDVNCLATDLGPSPGMEAITAYSRLEFAPPAAGTALQTVAMLDRNHIRVGEPLHLRIAAASPAAAKEQLRVGVLSGEGVGIAGQTVSVDVAPGVSVREAALDTSRLPSGGYTVRWRSVGGAGSGQAGLTVLPPFDPVAVERELAAESGRISDGSLETLRFDTAQVRDELARLKPYEAAPFLRATLERLDGRLRAAAAGRDVIAQATGIVRRAFRSQVDGTLQPYTVYVPGKTEPGKRYAALVYLHGSDSDDRSVAYVLRAHPWLVPEGMFVIAPFGRGKSNGFTRDHAQEDIREAVADALRHYPIDPARLVLAGFSMGGYGVYRTLYEDAGRYAAAAVLSGEPALDPEYGGGTAPDFRRPELLAPLRGKNVAVLHGGGDRNCPVELTRAVVAEMKSVGVRVLYLEDPGVGHEPPNDPAIRAQYLRWLEDAVRERPHPSSPSPR
jgi:predicted esterase